MNAGVNKTMPPPPVQQKQTVRLNSMPWFHGKVGLYLIQLIRQKKNERNDRIRLRSSNSNFSILKDY